MKHIGFWTHHNGATPRPAGTPKPEFPVAVFGRHPLAGREAVSAGMSMLNVEMPILNPQAAEYRAASLLAIAELHAASFARRSLTIA